MESWTALAKQYFEYGYWKAAVMRMHPDSARLRQLAPPVAVAGVMLGSALSPRHRWFALAPAAYGGVLAIGAARAARPLFILVTPLIHVCWSAGLIVGLTGGRAIDGVRSPADAPGG